MVYTNNDLIPPSDLKRGTQWMEGFLSCAIHLII